LFLNFQNFLKVLSRFGATWRRRRSRWGIRRLEERNSSRGGLIRRLEERAVQEGDWAWRKPCGLGFGGTYRV
jgi:hypothetical protein